MRDRILKRVGEMPTKSYKSRIGFSLDMFLLTPEGGLHDARVDPSAYQGTAGVASHVLAARPDLRDEEVDRFMGAISGPVAEVAKSMNDKVEALPKPWSTRP